MSIGVRLRAARQLAGVSTKELDRLAGVKPGNTWAVENSKTGNAETKTLDKLAGVLGVSLDWLVRGDGEEPNEEAVQAAVKTARAAQEPAA